MALRPIFIPTKKKDSHSLVDAISVDFIWHPGFAKVQAHKNIESLHESAKKQLKLNKILEISSKSKEVTGISLSAFNLKIKIKPNHFSSVESVFQGSKVFEKGGPYTDLYMASSKEAKKDIRLRDSGALTAFNFRGKKWPLIPKTLFYDWLYITSLCKTNSDLAKKILEFEAFTDIVFNPKKSLNCQAHSAALFVALNSRGLIERIMESSDKYIEVINKYSVGENDLNKSLFD
jgi:hypothetical protein